MRAAAICLVVLAAACGDSNGNDAGVADAVVAGDAASGCSLLCSSFDLAAGETRYDPASKQIRFQLAPGAQAVASGLISFQTDRAGGGIDQHTTTFTVSGGGRTLSADLSAFIGPSTMWFGAMSLTLVLGCGETVTVGDMGVTAGSGGSGLMLSNFRCG